MDASDQALWCHPGETNPAVNMPMHDSIKNLLANAREQSLRLKSKPSFLLLLLAGTVLSVLARWLAEGSTGAIIALMICVVFLGVYAYQSSDSADSHAPENLYYMGLLFTLVSLMYSLIVLFVFNIGDGNVGERVYNLVGSFGIALASTFVGIFLRIVLLQKTLPEREDELEEQARRDLAETASRLRRELMKAIEDMGRFRRAITQATNDAVRESAKAHGDVIRDAKKAASEKAGIFADMTGEIGDKLASAGDDIAAAAGNVKKLLDDMTEQQKQQHQDLIARGKKSTEQVAGDIRELLGKISGEFDAVLTHLQNVARDMQKTQKSIGAMAGGCNALNAEIKQTGKIFSDAASEVKQVTETMSADTRALSKAMAETARIAPQYSEQFKRQIGALRQEAEQWQSMTQKVRTTMLEAVESLTDAIKRK
ncbi:MAG: hypothetical protein OD918_00630 [Gammaproteobacteria bacterium]